MKKIFILIILLVLCFCFCLSKENEVFVLDKKYLPQCEQAIGTSNCIMYGFFDTRCTRKDIAASAGNYDQSILNGTINCVNICEDYYAILFNMDNYRGEYEVIFNSYYSSEYFMFEPKSIKIIHDKSINKFKKKKSMRFKSTCRNYSY
jgi:hypothetical protein